MPDVPSRLRRWAAALARQVTVLAAAYADPRTPLRARVVIVLVLAYALSPLDLIPDAIPVLGLLDDLVIVPLGVALSLRLLPPAVKRDALAAARRQRPRTPAGLGRWGTAAILLAWLALAAALAWLASRWLR